MQQFPSARKPLKWFALSPEEQRRRIDEFWLEYFTRYPLPGRNVEMNALRAHYLPRV